MAVFDGVRYSLSPTLSPTRRHALAAVLDLNGATPQQPYTHLIALPASHAHSDISTSDPTVKLITDRWVDRSLVLGKCQPEQYYSPDPAMIFSGVVACATDLAVPDLEVLSAGITALGGQWRIGLTRDVTHLFALRPGSDKYNTALHFAPQTHMCIVTPHWFDDAVRLGRRILEASYAWPDPPVLRPGVTLDRDDDAPATEGKRKRKLADAETEVGDGASVLTEGEQVRVWAGRRILLSASLELGASSRDAIETRIRRAGGVVVVVTDDTEEKAVGECDVFITRWRSGQSYFKAARESILIGTLAWLFSVESSGTLHSPFDSLLWYPTPRGGIPGLIDSEISITNYTGAARDYLKRLIELVGAKFTPSMSQSNKVLVAGFQPSPKTTRALSWSIPVVNHTWLEDCIVEWRALTVGLERYIVFPPGIDFGKMLMTRPDELPSSQPVATPRSGGGGAVPGGRGVGVVDVEREEIRDAEYHAGARRYSGLFGLSTARENDTTADGMSTAWPEGDMQAELPVRPRPRAGSVKKTPSRRGSISTSMMAPVTGAFVDHVIELPADDDDVGGRRGAPVNGKARAQTGSRAASRSVSRASSAGLFSAPVEVPNLGESSKGGKGKDKDQGMAVGDAGKRQTRLAEEVGADEDAPLRACPPKPKPRLVQRRPDVQTPEAEGEVVEQLPAQTSKPQKLTTKGMPMGVDSDSGESELSLPPRRAPAAGTMTPVKSGMKPRPRSKSISRPGSALGGESEIEVRIMAAESGTATGSGKQREHPAKTIHNGKVVAKNKGKEKEKANGGKKKVAEKIMPRARSPASSALSASPDATNDRVIAKEKGKEKANPRGGKKVTEKIVSRSPSPTSSPLSTSPDATHIKVLAKEKGKEKEKPGERKKVTEKTIPRPLSPPSSPLSTSPSVKNSRTLKRRLSVVVPSVPKDYFSSQPEGQGNCEPESEKRATDAGATSAPKHKQLKPTASIHAVSAEASTSANKRAKPHPATSSTTQHVSRDPEPLIKSKPKSGVSKKTAKTHANDDEDSDKGDKDTSMVIDVPLTSTGRSGPRRSAANKATTRLRDDIMPDVISFEKEQKQAKRKRSEDWELVSSGTGVGKEAVEERGGKRRKVPREEAEEVEEEAEVVEVILVPSAKAKRKSVNGKGKAKGRSTAGSDEDMDDPLGKTKPSGSEEKEKKGGRTRGKESTVIRVMTTGVTLSDDVVKRLSKLGVQMTNKPTDCTHLIAKGIVRTEKFLCSMPFSPYVLTEEWANASAKGGKLLSENDHLLSDTAAEQKWGFKFADAMARAKGPTGGSTLFKDMTFYVTPKVSVDAKLLKNVVSAGGGQVQTSTMPTVRILKGKANRYVVSCPEDKGIWSPLVQEGFKVYSPELLLRGALKQEIEWEKEACLVAG